MSPPAAQSFFSPWRAGWAAFRLEPTSMDWQRAVSTARWPLILADRAGQTAVSLADQTSAAAFLLAPVFQRRCEGTSPPRPRPWRPAHRRRNLPPLVPNRYTRVGTVPGNEREPSGRILSSGKEAGAHSVRS